MASPGTQTPAAGQAPRIDWNARAPWGAQPNIPFDQQRKPLFKPNHPDMMVPRKIRELEPDLKTRRAGDPHPFVDRPRPTYERRYDRRPGLAV